VGRYLKNPEVLNLQISLLNKRNLTELVERKKKKKSFLKITIIVFFLIVIFSLIGISTNKGSQGFFSSLRQLSTEGFPWLSESDYG